ncbi:thioredoxin [Deinococcus sp. KSM4-11]|uniref:thioredoxin n=1 Tax=Deinococcus sp. KSM4-11 TaxID=2568654 RepID=UPI00197AA559|nr:thioredoxin [Deinococcus sp. KSM4-11]
MTDAAPYILLTQEACAECERLKRLLAGPLKGHYGDRITVIHRQEQPEAFAHLAEQYELRAAPALLHVASGRTQRGKFGLGEVRRFLEQDW